MNRSNKRQYVSSNAQSSSSSSTTKVDRTSGPPTTKRAKTNADRTSEYLMDDGDEYDLIQVVEHHTQQSEAKQPQATSTSKPPVSNSRSTRNSSNAKNYNSNRPSTSKSSTSSRHSFVTKPTPAPATTLTTTITTAITSGSNATSNNSGSSIRGHTATSTRPANVLQPHEIPNMKPRTYRKGDIEKLNKDGRRPLNMETYYSSSPTNFKTHQNDSLEFSQYISQIPQTLPDDTDSQQFLQPSEKIIKFFNTESSQKRQVRSKMSIQRQFKADMREDNKGFKVFMYKLKKRAKNKNKIKKLFNNNNKPNKSNKHKTVENRENETTSANKPVEQKKPKQVAELCRQIMELDGDFKKMPTPEYKKTNKEFRVFERYFVNFYNHRPRVTTNFQKRS